jgi:hypothetical protein
MMGCRFAVTEQADLHLVRSEGKFFVKPLPDFLLHHGFWAAHICPDPELYANSVGFVRSYTWLVRYRSDFNIAKDERLLPDDMTWQDWTAFVSSLSEGDGHLMASRRYQYGELRLSRLDQIYRLAPTFMFRNLISGYLYIYSSYGGFFRREFAWLVVAFAYISIILSAMQVGLTTGQLQDNEAFNNGAFGFAVLAIVFPVTISGLVLMLYIALWIYHVTTTLCHHIPVRRNEKREVQRYGHGREAETSRKATRKSEKGLPTGSTNGIDYA